jgi:hypothetical protein
MNKLLTAAAVSVVLAFQAPAKAAVITVLAPGVLSDGSPAATFDGQTQTPYGLTTPAGNFADGGALFSGSGIVMRNGPLGDQPSLGLYAEPFHDTTNYLAVLGGGSETISYSAAMDRFGLYWGSVDTWNTIAFYNGNTLIDSFTGSQIVPLIADGNQVDDHSNRYVIFSDLNFNKVILSSSQNSFEVDNISAAVPELSTWAMMLMGFAGIGFAAYRRAKKCSKAIKAA